jgi:uncharacterized membrane protein YfcA
MEITALALFASLGLGAGLMIGCVGIGGVILVPALVYLADVPIHVAIAAAMFAFLLSGVVGTVVFARNNSIRWDMTAWMWAGAMPAAFAGALAANAVSGWIIELAVGALTAASGVHSLMGQAQPDAADGGTISNPVLAVIGAITGFASALTGTGGPLVLIPMLVALQLPVLAAIGLAQAVQLPIAVLATGGNILAGSLDAVLGSILGCGIVFGTWAGAKLAHVLPRSILRTFVSALLVIVGGLILIKLAIAFGS